jgi:hypothetical protein
MSDQVTLAVSEALETLLVAHNHRGMRGVGATLERGYLLRAAQMIRGCTGRAYILTGFPVAGTFETDGPAGAMALYQLLVQRGAQPTILSDRSIADALSADFHCIGLATGTRSEIAGAVSLLYQQAPPDLVISIERPGAATDGHCYNMAGDDISADCSSAEPYPELATCPTIAVGDGGNELGMGKAQAALAALNIRAAISDCDELIVADVSNWAIYALHAFVQWLDNKPHTPALDIQQALAYLVALGAVDGVTGLPTPTEDGFPATAGPYLLEKANSILTRTAAA